MNANRAIISGLSMLVLVSLLVSSCGRKSNGATQTDTQTQGKWDIGVALYSFKAFPFRESLEKAKTAGADYVEGFTFHKLGEKFNNKSMLQLSDDELKEMGKMIESEGLRMKSVYAGAKTASEWKNVFELGRKLDIEFFVCEPMPQHLDLLDSLTREYGIRVAIHQHAKGRSRYWHPDSVKVAIEARPNFGVCADLGHWVRSGLDPVECLAQLEGRLISVHAKDLDEFGNVDANDVKVGSGVIDYPSVLKELDRQSFSGLIYVECEHDWETNLEDVWFAMQYLNELTEKKSAK